MSFTNSKEFNLLLEGFRQGDEQAASKLFALAYQDLHNLARQYMRRERPGHTMQATALVHEAYLRLFNEEKIEWQDRQHFFVIAARQMRRILVDYARRTLPGGKETARNSRSKIWQPCRNWQTECWSDWMTR